MCAKSDQRCVVCTELGASKHYGNNCCSGCKGFFRRSIRHHREYVCMYDSKCDITKDSRNCCRACRLRICLEQGLRPACKFPLSMIIAVEVVHSDRCHDADAVRFRRRAKKSANCRGEDVPDLADVERCRNHAELGVSNQYSLPWTTTQLLHVGLPLGAKKMIPLFQPTSPTSVQRFLFALDNLVDNYAGVQERLLSPEITCNMDMSLADAFLQPEAMIKRAPYELGTDVLVMDGGTVNKMWCRMTQHYIDWASHLPQLDQLCPEDRLRLLIGRDVPLTCHIAALRCMHLTSSNIPLCGGAYMHNQASSWENTDIVSFGVMCSQLLEIIYENFLPQVRSVNASDTEIRILRVIAFFTVVPGLTKEGRRIVRNAQAFYRGLLYDFIVFQNSHLSASQVTDRVSALISSIHCMEASTYVEDRYFSVLAMFNRDCQSNLFFEFYIKRKFR